MAFVTPYADGNAHGSIGNAYTFRRSPGGVVLEKKPVCPYDRTPLQDDNRTQFGEIVHKTKELINTFKTLSLPSVAKFDYDRYSNFIGRFIRPGIGTNPLFSFTGFANYGQSGDEYNGKFYHGKFGLIAWSPVLKRWLNCGGQFGNDPTFYPFINHHRYLRDLQLIYSCDFPVPLRPEMSLNVLNDADEVVAHIYMSPRPIKKTGAVLWWLDWLGVMLFPPVVPPLIRLTPHRWFDWCLWG
jgi:hypothetical protein